MALTKRVERTIEILPDGTLQIRDATVIEEDGLELAKTYHRKCLAPGDSVEAETCERTKAVAQTVWTKDVQDAYAAKIAAVMAAEKITK